MKIEVSIERDQQGRLHGYIVEWAGEAVLRGDDLLKHRTFKHIDNACSECTGKLHSMFKSSIMDPLKITFIYDGGKSWQQQKSAAASRPRST